jgi:hypothetical protein
MQVRQWGRRSQLASQRLDTVLGGPNVLVSSGPNGTSLAAAPATASTWDLFGYTLAGDQLTIRDRWLFIDQIASVEVPEQTIALDGNPAWVCAQIVRTGWTLNAVLCQADQPSSDADYFLWPLYCFTLAASVYTLATADKFNLTMGAPTK